MAFCDKQKSLYREITKVSKNLKSQFPPNFSSNILESMSGWIMATTLYNSISEPFMFGKKYNKCQKVCFENQDNLWFKSWQK